MKKGWIMFNLFNGTLDMCSLINHCEAKCPTFTDVIKYLTATAI